MNTEKIQTEVNKIIQNATLMYGGAKMNHTTLKAQQELRDLGLEEYVPTWIMRKGAKANRIISELIKSAKQDGTQLDRGTSHMTADGDGEFVADRTIPASVLYNLLNATEEVHKINEETIYNLEHEWFGDGGKVTIVQAQSMVDEWQTEGFYYGWTLKVESISNELRLYAYSNSVESEILSTGWTKVTNDISYVIIGEELQVENAE